MKDEEIAVGRHYDQNVLAYEQDRLELHCPVNNLMIDAEQFGKLLVSLNPEVLSSRLE